MGLLDGKVAAITGAGGGLGRAHALLMAKEGAKVVVNDLGTSLHGEGEGQDLADQVVEEIEGFGGEAYANKASVADPEGAQSIIDDAFDEFGRLDIVVNNAGILRDKTIVKMTDEMWQAVIDVHLSGTFYVTRAAMRAFSDQEEGGRIINTTSLAGLKGNFGQANYGSAKAGIAGLTRVVALEGQRDNITVNAIAPVAKTRMTDHIDRVPEEYAPDEIAPLVAWLASDDAGDVTGRIFGCHGKHFFEYVMETTPGLEPEDAWTPSSVGERFDEITEMPEPAAESADSETAGQVQTLFEALPGTVDESRASGWSATIQFDVSGAGTYTIDVDDGVASFIAGEADDADGTVTFDGAQTILDMAAGKLNPEKAFMAGKVESDNMQVLMSFGKYFDLESAAESIQGGGAEDSGDDSEPSEGLNRDLIGEKYRGGSTLVEREDMVAYAEATDADNPQYTEGDIIAPPLFPVRLFHPMVEEVLTDDRLNVDLLRLVHGEQDMRFHRPLKPKDLVAPRARIESIEDKSSGQVMNIHLRLMSAGELVAEADNVVFIRAEDGGSKDGGGSKKKSSEKDETADRDYLVEASQLVADDQADRYAEASGDHNPIHTDPDVAKSAGLKGVILHGLCTMAFASNAVVDNVCDDDARRLKRLKVRFSKPVFPGQTVTTRIWSEGTEDGLDVYGLDAVNDDGTRVLTNGIAEVEG